MDNVGINFLGGTYGGNAVCCAAANSTLDVMYSENILKNVNIMGKYLKESLEGINGVSEVRQYGLMIAFEVPNPTKLVLDLNKEKVLVLLSGDRGQYVRLLPSLNITMLDCDIFIDRLKKL